MSCIKEPANYIRLLRLNGSNSYRHWPKAQQTETIEIERAPGEYWLFKKHSYSHFDHCWCYDQIP